MKSKCLNSDRLEWLKQNYPNLGGKKCSEMLNIPYDKIRKIAFKLKIKVSQETKNKIQLENSTKSVKKTQKYFLDNEKLEWFKLNYPKIGGEECSKHLNLPHKYIHNLAKKFNLKIYKETKHKIYSNMNKKYFVKKDDLEWFKNNYSYLGGEECSKHLVIPLKYLHKMASIFGLKVCKETKSKEKSKTIIKYYNEKRELDKEKANDIKIDTPEKAYTLGFLWGDGYLRFVGQRRYATLDIVKSDFECISNLFECWGNWSTFNRKEIVGHRARVSSFSGNSIFGYFLENNDYKNKSKHSPSKILSCIPENLKQYWWRGYSDADGCFYFSDKNKIWQFSIAGSYDQDWSESEKLFEKLNISKYKISRRTHEKNKSFKDAKDSIIRFSNKDGIIKFGDFIYNDKIEIGLNRKYKKYLQVKHYVNVHIRSNIG